MGKLNIAIVGCGSISQLNVPGYLDHPQCDVVALCDPVLDRATAKAKYWGITPKIYTDYSDLLNDAHVDAVELLTPTYMHIDQIIDALNSGKHVSCQKPICSNLDEVERIDEAIRSSNRTFRITENFLYYPPIVKAKILIDSGQIGEPSLVRIRTIRGDVSNARIVVEEEAHKWRMDAKLNAGGTLYDDGWHKYATAIFWVGEVEKVTSIVSENSNFTRTGIDDVRGPVNECPSATIMKVKNKDCLITIDYASTHELPFKTKYYPVDEFFEIVGEKGIIWVTRCSGESLDLPPLMLFKEDSPTCYYLGSDWIEGFNGAAKSFVEGILLGRQPHMDIGFARHVLDVGLSVYKSSEIESVVYTSL